MASTAAWEKKKQLRKINSLPSPSQQNLGRSQDILYKHAAKGWSVVVFGEVHPSAPTGRRAVASPHQSHWWTTCLSHQLPVCACAPPPPARRAGASSCSVFPPSCCHCAVGGTRPGTLNAPPLGPEAGVPGCIEETGLMGSDPLCTPPGWDCCNFFLVIFLSFARLFWNQIFTCARRQK